MVTQKIFHMKKILFSILCMSIAFTSWGQESSSMMFNMDFGLGIPSDAAKEVAGPSNAGTIALNFGMQKPVMKVFKNTSAILGLQFTHINMTHDEKHSPANFANVSHDLETNTNLIAPTLRFETAIGNIFPYVEAGAGLMTQRSNIVTTSENEDAGAFECNSNDVTRTKINDMQTQLGLQSAVGVSYGRDYWKINLRANFMKGTQSFLIPERNFKDSFTFEDAGEHYIWNAVRPDIMNIRIGMTFSLGGSCMRK